MHVAEFFLPWQPRAWKRAQPHFIKANSGKGFIKMIDPPTNKYYKDLVLHRFARCVMNQGIHAVFPWEGPVRLTTHALFLPARTTHWPDKQHLQDPDVDNLIKIVLDGLKVPSKKLLAEYALDPANEYKVWAYRDDNQLVQIVSTKDFWNQQGMVVKVEFFEKIEKPRRRLG